MVYELILGTYLIIGYFVGMMYWFYILDNGMPPVWKIAIATFLSGPILWAMVACFYVAYPIFILFRWLTI